MKYLRLFESYKNKMLSSSDNFTFNYDDIKWYYENYTSKMRNISTFDNQNWNARWIYEHYDEYKDNYDTLFKDYETFVNDRLKELIDIGGHFYYDRKGIVTTFLSSEDIYENDHWPFLIYVSGTGDNGDEIGLLMHQNKQIEQFEGNEESSEQTDQLVNKLLGIGDKEIRVYGQHGEELVWKMKEENFLEKNIYVTPDKSYAEGYWHLEQNRLMFSCLVKLKHLKQESDVDWRVLEKVPVKNFKIL